MPKAKSSTAAAKGGKKQKKDPNAPKRGSSAYIIFSNDMREQVKSENPGIAFGDIAKEISERWKTADAKQKAKYEELSKKDKARYEREMASYAPGSGASSSKSKSKKAAKGSEDEDEDDVADEDDE